MGKNHKILLMIKYVSMFKLVLNQKNSSKRLKTASKHHETAHNGFKMKVSVVEVAAKMMVLLMPLDKIATVAFSLAKVKFDLKKDFMNL